MISALAHRPLALAGAGVVLGAVVTLRLSGGSGPGWLLIIEAALLGGALILRSRGRAIGRDLAAARTLAPIVPLLGAFGGLAVGSLAGIAAASSQLDQSAQATAAQVAWRTPRESARAPPVPARTQRTSARAQPVSARAQPAAEGSMALHHRLVSVELRVLSAGEDPWAERAWLDGRGHGGRRIRCLWPGKLPDAIGRGALVRATGRLEIPRGATNPGQRDAARSLARNGIAARVYLKQLANLAVIEGGGSAWPRRVQSVRREATLRLRTHLPRADAGIAAALLLGIRGGLDDRDRLRFERTGTMHLLAISGLHLLLVAGMVHAIVRRLGAGPRVAALLTLVVVLGYVPIAGAGAPVRRAAIGLAVYGVALLRGRRPDAATALGGAATLLVLWDPVEVERIGFWLSFLAAASIAWLAPAWIEIASARTRLLARFPAVRKDRPIRLRIARSIAQGLPVALAASCATQPLVAHQFGLVTPLSPLTNLAAAPFVTLLMPLYGLLAAGADWAALPATLLLRGLRFVLDAGELLPGAFVRVAPPAIGAMAVWWLGLILTRRRPRTGALVAVAALTFAWPSRAPTAPQFWLLDVGHGQAALIVDTSGHAALIDAGSRNRLDIARRVVEPALRTLGIDRLEVCVCTHADSDHWNALLPLLGRIPIGALIVGPDPPPALIARAALVGVPVVRAQSGQRIWRGRGVDLRIWGTATTGRRRSSNDRSLVAVARLGPRRIFLPADRQVAGLRDLLRDPPARCSVLVAPHHGASVRIPVVAAALGRAVRPTWLLVSGARGSFHVPTLRALGAAHLLRTDRDGALLVELRPDHTLAVQTPFAPRRTFATIAPP